MSDLTARERARTGGTTPQDISPEQYQRAWEMFREWKTHMSILAEVGLTRAQLRWLIESGSERRNMPSFSARMIEIAMAFRTKEFDAAVLMSEGGLKDLKRGLDNASLAKGYVNLVVGDLLQRTADERQAARAENRAMDQNKITLTDGVRKTLIAIRSFADTTGLAQMYMAVFTGRGKLDTGSAILDKLTSQLDGVAHDDREGSAAFELMQGFSESANDSILAELVPGSENWTLEQIEHYLATDEKPIDVEATEA